MGTQNQHSTVGNPLNFAFRTSHFGLKTDSALSTQLSELPLCARRASVVSLSYSPLPIAHCPLPLGIAFHPHFTMSLCRHVAPWPFNVFMAVQLIFKGGEGPSLNTQRSTLNNSDQPSTSTISLLLNQFENRHSTFENPFESHLFLPSPPLAGRGPG